MAYHATMDSLKPRIIKFNIRTGADAIIYLTSI